MPVLGFVTEYSIATFDDQNEASGDDPNEAAGAYTAKALAAGAPVLTTPYRCIHTPGPEPVGTATDVTRYGAYLNGVNSVLAAFGDPQARAIMSEIGKEATTQSATQNLQRDWLWNRFAEIKAGTTTAPRGRSRPCRLGRTGSSSIRASDPTSARIWASRDRGFPGPTRGGCTTRSRRSASSPRTTGESLSAARRSKGVRLI